MDSCLFGNGEEQFATPVVVVRWWFSSIYFFAMYSALFPYSPITDSTAACKSWGVRSGALVYRQPKKLSPAVIDEERLASMGHAIFGCAAVMLE